MKGKEKLLLILLAIVIISIVATACGRNYCKMHYPCIEKDSISIIQTANIDTVYLQMPADTVKLETQIDCPDQKVIYKDGKVEYRVVIKDKVLTLYKISERDSLRLIYAYKNTEEFKKLTQVKYVDVIKHKVPKWCWYSLGLNLLLLIWITRKFWIGLINRIKFPL